MTPVATPELLIVATLVLLEVQLTKLLTPAMDPSDNVAVAVNCCWPPLVIVGLSGEIAMLVMFLEATVIGTPVAVTLPDFAPIVVFAKVVPDGRLAAAVASPAALMVATLVAEEDQVTWEVTSPVVLLPKVAVAVNCCVPLGKAKALVGLMLSETISLAEGKKRPQPGRATAMTNAVRKPRNKTSLCTL